MASPEGTVAETAESTDPVAIVADGLSIDERSTLAYQQLKAGVDPKVINEGFNAPFEDSKDDAETADGTPEEATGPTDSKSESGKEPDNDEHRTKLTIARKSLIRDGWKEEALSKLDDDELIEIGMKRGEVQADIDRKFSESGKKPSDGDTTRESTTEPDDLFNEVREYDDDLGQKAEERYKAVVKERDELRDQVVREKFQAVVEKAKSEFPELNDEAKLDRVIDKAKLLAANPAYRTAGEAFEDACKICLGDEREQAAQKQLLDRNRAERDGQIDATVEKDPETQPMTEDQIQSLSYKLLTKGIAPEEVRRRTSKIPRVDE